jgi:DNA-binding transcriptional LysR family regulator
LVRTASAPPGEAAGVVRLSVSEFVGIEVLPAMLAPLRRRLPRLDALVMRKAGTVPLGFFAHRNYLAERGVPETLADLAAHDLIGPDRTRADIELATGLHPAIPRDRFVIRTDSHPAQPAAARAGLGIAAVQRPIGLAEPELRAVLPELVLASLDVWIVTHEDLRDLPRVRETFDHLVAEFTGYTRPTSAQGS